MTMFRIFVLFVWATLTSTVYSAVWISSVTLNGAQETPANGSSGTGSGTVTFDDVTKQISLSGSFSGLTGQTIAAHVHGPAVSGVAAGVVFGITYTPVATSGTFSGSATYNATQETQLFAGLQYINIHTTIFGGGEIRGQIENFSPVPEPKEYALIAGVGLVGFAAWRKRRLVPASA